MPEPITNSGAAASAAYDLRAALVALEPRILACFGCASVLKDLLESSRLGCRTRTIDIRSEDRLAAVIYEVQEGLESLVDDVNAALARDDLARGER